jgi:AcrR family transcriptional regulator
MRSGIDMRSGTDTSQRRPERSRDKAPTAAEVVDQDKTARARIRDAALELFGRDGFNKATIRAIARRAGVSPALVVHHYGSKDHLREEVDDHVADVIREGKLSAMTGGLLSADAYADIVDTYGSYLAYMSRSLTDNSEAGNRFYDRLFADALEYLKIGEENGVIRSGEDPRARAAFLLNSGLATLVLGRHTMRVLESPDVTAAAMRVATPTLDIYTDGLFTDDRFRDVFRDERKGGA